LTLSLLNKSAIPQCLSLPFNASHCLSMPLIAFQCLSLPFNASHYLSMPLIAFQCLSLPFNASHCLSMPLISFQCLSLPFNASHCLDQETLVWLFSTGWCKEHIWMWISKQYYFNRNQSKITKVEYIPPHRCTYIPHEQQRSSLDHLDVSGHNQTYWPTLCPQTQTSYDL